MTTAASMKPAIKLWIVFCTDMLDVDEFCLFDAPPPRPSAACVRAADERLLLFANWLLQDYAAATATQYVTTVRSKHTDWLGGVSLRELGVEFPRVAARLTLARKQRPGKTRAKVPFTAQLLTDCLPFLWRAGQHWYSRAATYAAMSFCLEQLLRLNEVTSDRASAPSGANWVPICVGDVAFFDVNDAAVVHPRSLSDGRRRERTVSYMRCKMPRSKSDASGRNPDLFSPAGLPWLRRVVRRPGAVPSRATAPPAVCRWPSGPLPDSAVAGDGALGACQAIWALLSAFPVPASSAFCCPLFAADRGSALQMSKQSFSKWFAAAMTAGGHADHAKFGAHCFRVGGVVAMQEAGASVSEVMAQGRWKSDVWKLYCRRGKRRSMHWGKSILRLPRCSVKFPSAVRR